MLLLDLQILRQVCSPVFWTFIFTCNKKSVTRWLCCVCCLYVIVDVNVCLKSNPCKNGGTCAKYGAGYECLCPPIWAGDNCEMSKQITAARISSYSIAIYKRTSFAYVSVTDCRGQSATAIRQFILAYKFCVIIAHYYYYFSYLDSRRKKNLNYYYYYFIM